ncbi:MAG: MFS transporter [Gammaproteobacteria bacterium]|nr:MAG: MFS transporter [Gammaproteobacteria bacterium]
MKALFQFILLWLAGLGASTQYAKLSLALPALEAYYGSAGARLGLLVSLLSFVGLAFGLGAASVVAALGFRRMLITALVLGAGVALLESLLPPLPVMFALRLVEGVSHLLLVVVIPTLIASIASERLRAVAMTLWGTFFGVGFALVGAFGLPLLEARGLSAFLVAHAVWMGLMACLVVMLVEKGRASREERAWHPAFFSLALHREVYTSIPIATSALVWLFYTATYVSALTLTPKWVGADEAVALAALLPLVSIVSSVTIGNLLLLRFPAVTVVKTGLVAALLTVMAMAFSGPVASLLMALFASIGLVQGASFAVVPELNRDTHDRVLANGAMAQTGNIGNLVGTPLLLMLFQSGGKAAALLYLGACYLAGLGVLVGLGWLARRQ